jgi:aspartate/methionine/tyrosine aminotransferase
MSENVFNEIVKISKENGMWILSDEVYRGSELNGKECRTFAGVTEKTIVNGGLSKAYSLPGLRLGWTIGDEKYIQKVWSLHDYTVISIPIMSDWIASIILSDDRRKKILKRTRNHLIKNFNILNKWSKNINNLTITMPDAAAITFAKLNNNMLSEDFVFSLKNEKSVLLTAGKWHGLEGYVRIGYGAPKLYLLSALDRISEYLTNNLK